MSNLIDEIITILKVRLDCVDDLAISICETTETQVIYDIIVSSTDYPDGIKVIHILNVSPTVSIARQLEKVIEKHVIIVSDLSPTAQFKKIFSSRTDVELFMTEEIMRCILKHKFLPPFTIIKETHDSSDILPKIEQNDIFCRLLNLKTNDIVEFHLSWGDFDLRSLRRIVV